MEAEGPGRQEVVGPAAIGITAENPGPLTLDGTRTWVVGVERVAVVDPGPNDPEHLDRVDRAIGGRPVVAVCLTHSHGDHSAGAASAAVRWARLHASAETLDRVGLEGVALEGGDEIALEDSVRSLRAVHTPGHSGDHLAYLLEPERYVLTGDLVLGRGSSMVAHPDGSVSAYLASLARLTALRPALMLPGHGPVIEDAAAKLSEYASHRRERTDQVRAALENGVQTLPDLLRAVYGELPPGVVQAAELSLLAHLEHLSELGYSHRWASEGTTDLR